MQNIKKKHEDFITDESNSQKNYEQIIRFDFNLSHFFYF